MYVTLYNTSSLLPTFPPSLLPSLTSQITSQSSKVVQKIALLQCYRVFDARTKGLDLNYCIGLEVDKDTFYIKVESASEYNHWIPVS